MSTGTPHERPEASRGRARASDQGPRGPNPTVREWLAETGLAVGMPWGVIFTHQPIAERGPNAALHLAGYYQVNRPDCGAELVELDMSFTLPIAEIGDGWRGHQLALFGLLRHIDVLGLPAFARPATTPGRAPVFRLTWLALELWRQRAYRTLTDPLVAELHWWPGEKAPVPFFRPTVAPDARIKPADVEAALGRRRLLNRFARPFRIGGRRGGSGTFKDGAALRATLNPIISELKAKQVEPTQRRVLRHLPFDTDERTLRRWVSDLLELDWNAYIESVP